MLPPGRLAAIVTIDPAAVPTTKDGGAGSLLVQPEPLPEAERGIEALPLLRSVFHPIFPRPGLIRSSRQGSPGNRVSQAPASLGGVMERSAHSEGTNDLHEVWLGLWCWLKHLETQL